MTHAVLLGRPDAFDASLAGKALAAFQKIPLSDAVHLAKKRSGLLAENLDPGAASKLLEHLAASGLEAKVIPQDQVHILAPAAEAAKLALEPERLTIELKSRQSVQIPWSALELIAACAHEERQTRIVVEKQGPSASQKAIKIGVLLATGLPLPIGGKTKTVEKKQELSELQVHLDLHIQNAPFHIRIDAKTLDYSFLKARKAYSMLPNFRLLLADVVQSAPKALRNRGTQFLLSGRPISDQGYHSLDDLDHESRWLLTLRNAIL